MKKKAILGSALLGLTIILLTMSGSVTQAQIISQNTTLDADILNPVFVEEMRIIAGIDSAAVVELDLIGGAMPAIDANPLFSEVKSWAFVASNQSDFQDYILRRPFKSPENATLLLEIDASLGVGGSLVRAIEIALLFNAAYGTNLMWSRAEGLLGSYLYIFSGSMPETIFNTLITEFQTDISNGFVSLLDPVEVTDSPVKVAFMGNMKVDGKLTAARGVYYIDPDAITGATTYTLSTDNIFGENVWPRIALQPIFSVLKFRFPYTINPLSITPDPNNFAPQITGKMDWDLNTPWSLPKLGSNYEVVFNINHTALASSPRVSVNMAYDQDLLNTAGRLQMDYVVSNTGTEDAVDIEISYPLGPDFLDFLAQKPKLWDLRDDVTIDEGYSNAITGTILMTFEGEMFIDEGLYPDIIYEQEFLILDGWYQNNTDMSYIDINPANTIQQVKTDSMFYDLGIPGQTGTVSTYINFNSSLGLPNALVDQATAFLAPISMFDYELHTLGDLIADYQFELKDAVQAAGDYLFNILYSEQDIFTPDTMDFDFITKEIGRVGLEDSYNETFLSTIIPLLHPGESVNVSWALDNIPSQANHYGMMGLDEVNVGASFPALQLTTVDKTGYDVLRYLFGLGDAILPHLGDRFSRPLSYYEPWTNTWLSTGARFAYMDAEGFEYYGFSNGINLQIADDEAVLNVHVSLNQTAYLVGDPVTVYYTIENTGNLPAEEVILALYHGRMGPDWQLVDPELFWVDEIGTIAPGAIYNSQADVLANSFLGIHPVYGVVGFKSDVGQTILSDGIIELSPGSLGLTSIFAGAAETYQIVASNMDWGLVLPKTLNRRPAFPQPILDIDVSVEYIIPTDAPWELEITITVTNIGDERTHITAVQFYNATEMQLLRKTTTKGLTANETYLGIGVIRFKGITLLPGESVIFTMRWMFLTSYGCYIPGIIIVYDSRFRSDLAVDGIIEAPDVTDAALLAALDGSAQEEEDWEDYGQSTQTGSSAGADVFTGGTHTRRLGSYDIVFWSISAIFVTAVATGTRKKLKK